MKLRVIVENKINSLYTSYETLSNQDYEGKLNETKKQFSFASEYLDDVTKDIKNIIQLDTSIIAKIVSDSGWKMINEQLTNIKLVLEARYEGIIITLTEEQNEFLRTFIVSLQRRVEELNNLIGYYSNCVERTNHEVEIIESDIDALEDLLQRLSDPKNKELLNKEDFKLIYRIFIEEPGVNNTIKKNILKEYIKYNNSLLEQDNKKEIVNIDDVKALLKEYGVFQETIDKLDKYKAEIENNANLDKIREMLEYLVLNDEISNKRNIVNSFGESVLICILLYGDVEQVRSKYNYQISRYGHILSIYLDTPAFWINNISQSRKRKKNRTGEKEKTSAPLLYTSAHSTSVEDLELNEEFLTSKGFNVSISEEVNVKTLKTRHAVIRDNYEAFVNYGIIDPNNLERFYISALTFSNVLEHLDNLVEVGLLDDCLETEKPQCAYTSIHSSVIQNTTPEKYMFLYKLKASMSLDEYYGVIFNKYKQGMLAISTITTMMRNEGLDSKTAKDYAKNNFVSLENIIPNYELYLDCIYRANLVTHNEAILNDPLIQELENNYKVTKYSYRIGNQTISRLKVLRNFTALRNFGYIDEEALLFCITYNSYIDEATLNNIKGALKISGGGR